MFDNVYTSPTRPLAAERDEFAAYLDSFADNAAMAGEEAGR